ncbi:hypothetical protein K435DRAFT_797595 [Dendrothele bispora CBS 962.96]|nr:hypothetical protein K435DRAFT_797595 [Dendrothele bispora CBS 962.96]
MTGKEPVMRLQLGGVSSDSLKCVRQRNDQVTKIAGPTYLAFPLHPNEMSRENIFFHDQVHLRAVRNDERLKEVLGEAIRPEPEWWLNGDPRIKGAGTSELCISYIFIKYPLCDLAIFPSKLKPTNPEQPTRSIEDSVNDERCCGHAFQERA